MNKAVSKVTVVFLSLCVLAIMGVWGFLIYKTGKTSSEISLIGTEARNKNSESSYISAVRNTMRDSKEELAKIDGRFVSEDSVPEFINVLEDRAAQTGIRADLGSINVEPARDDVPYPLLRVKMAGSGRWEKIVGFISTLDALPYVTRIENVTFIKASDNGSKSATTTWSFNLDLVQYIKEKK